MSPKMTPAPALDRSVTPAPPPITWMDVEQVRSALIWIREEMTWPGVIHLVQELEEFLEARTDLEDLRRPEPTPPLLPLMEASGGGGGGGSAA